MSTPTAIYWHALNIIINSELWKLIPISNELGGPEAIFRANKDRLLQVGLPPSSITKIITGINKLDPAIEWQRLSNMGIQAICIDDPLYPRQLKQIPSPPPIIYVRGNLNALTNQTIGVVGSRKISSYGKEVIQYLIPELVDYGVNLASGMAFGVDANALSTCIECGGIPIGVLASSLDFHEINPKSNLGLANQIIKHGCLISENPPGRMAHKMYFPLRNRIISGLSLGVVIVEGALESGSLITAKAALEQNREVFAVPGSIFSENCAGPLALIKQGAKCVTSFQDIALEFGWDLKPRQQIIHFSDETQDKICRYLAHTPAGINELIEILTLTPQKVLVALTELEIMGILRRSAEGVYTKVR